MKKTSIQSSEYKEIMSKSKNPSQTYSKIQTLMSYFDEWEQNLISREENLKVPNKKPELKQPDISNDDEFFSNEQLLNNFKVILDEKEQEINKLKSNIEEKERIIAIKSKELQEIQIKFPEIPEKNKEGLTPFSEKTNKENNWRNKENQLKELNKDLESKKIEVINMWDEVLLKAEMLEKKENENEVRKLKLEQKKLEYEQLVQKINLEKAEFFQTQTFRTEEEKDKEKKLSEKERFLFEKSNELEQKQKDFFLKTKKIYEMIKMLNKHLKNPNLAALLQDELFSGDKNLMMTEELSSFETSLNKSSVHWSNDKEDDIVDETGKRINNVPIFNKTADQEINLLSENSFEMIKNSMSFSNNQENIESRIEKSQFKEAKAYLPFQGKK